MPPSERSASASIVLVFAPMVYDATHSRKHAMAEAARARGLRAIYVERPTSRSAYTRGGGRPSLSRAGGLVRAPDGPEVLAVPKKRSIGPLRYSLGEGRDAAARGRWIRRVLERELDPGAETIAIVTTARWWPALEGIEFTHLVYDKNDEPHVLRGPLSEEEYLRREREIVARADLLTAPSRSILEAGRSHRPEIPATLLRNGVEWEVFAARKDAPVPEFEDIESPIVGFLGTVADWIDVDLIADCAEAYPDFYFPIVGPVRPSVDVSRLESLPNVALWGPVPFDRVPAIMNRFDVCLVPFREGPISESACPVKFFEYLALGKPIVGTPMPELADLADLYHMTREGLVEAVGRAAAEKDDEDLAARRREAGREYGWDRLFGKLLDALGRATSGTRT